MDVLYCAKEFFHYVFYFTFVQIPHFLQTWHFLIIHHQVSSIFFVFEIKGLVPDYVWMIQRSNVYELFLETSSLFFIYPDAFHGISFFSQFVDAFPDNPNGSLTYFFANLVFFLEAGDVGNADLWSLGFSLMVF